MVWCRGELSAEGVRGPDRPFRGCQVRSEMRIVQHRLADTLHFLGVLADFQAEHFLGQMLSDQLVAAAVWVDAVEGERDGGQVEDLVDLEPRSRPARGWACWPCGCRYCRIGSFRGVTILGRRDCRLPCVSWATPRL